MGIDSAPLIELNSVDDYLGRGASRFFGVGYRRVEYAVRNTGLTTAGVTSTVAVGYPADWSTKLPGSTQRPHLSTIDTLILAVRAAEFHVRHAYGTTGAVWARRVDIKAPAAPVEETLDRVPVTARLRPAEPGRAASTYDVQVAGMRARVELVHGAGGAVEAPADLDAAFGGHPGLYGSGFRSRSQHIGNLLVDVPALTAYADVAVRGPDARPTVSLVDSFVVALQLGQILLYEADRVSRAASNTLWMRHTTLTATRPEHLAGVGPFRAYTVLADSDLIESRGQAWRTATIAGDCLGVLTRCAVAHRLP